MDNDLQGQRAQSSDLKEQPTQRSVKVVVQVQECLAAMMTNWMVAPADELDEAYVPGQSTRRLPFEGLLLASRWKRMYLSLIAEAYRRVFEQGLHSI
jgi:hypothetical protein